MTSMRTKHNNIQGKWTVFICLALFIACRSEPDKTVEGKWLVDVAYRNGMVTTTLENAYFHFNNDSILTTNIFRRDNQYNYRQEDNQLIQQSDPPMSYMIKVASEDSLVLATTISGYSFELHLRPDTVLLHE